jgi:hypothetical protein
LGATGRLACSFLPLRQYSVRVCWPRSDNMIYIQHIYGRLQTGSTVCRAGQ